MKKNCSQWASNNRNKIGQQFAQYFCSWKGFITIKPIREHEVQVTAVRFDQLKFESLLYLLGCIVQSTINYHLPLIGAFAKFPSEVAEELFLRENRPHKTFESLVIFSDVEWISLAETKKSNGFTLFPWAGKERIRFLKHLWLSSFLLLNHIKV